MDLTGAGNLSGVGPDRAVNEIRPGIRKINLNNRDLIITPMLY
jgi:hypothetical protein